jgi:Zn-dependent M28 family amino/carboxypeptidase
MANSDIANWALSASAIDDDNYIQPGDFWKKDHILSNWDEALVYAQGQISTSSTKIRRDFLQHQLLPLVKQQGKHKNFLRLINN